MGFQRTHSFQDKSSRTPEPTTQFRVRPFEAPVQMKPKGQPTPEELENEAFNQNKFEAFGLQLKEESGTITPVEQERLGVLQAKMNDFRAQRLERASRFGLDISKVSFTPREGQAAPQLQPMWRQGTPGVPMEEPRSPLNSPQQSLASPSQRQLTIGQPGSRGGQELIAHELTHVVQQNEGAVRRSSLPQQQLLQHTAMDVVQRLTGRVRSMVDSVENIFKRGSALLITSVADKPAEEVKKYQEIIARAKAKLATYVASDRIVENNTPQLNPMLEDEPVFISNDTITVTEDYIGMEDKARQARMLLELLTQDEVVDEGLFSVMDKANLKFRDHQEITLTPGTSLYRVLNAASAYKYIANGISRVGNNDNWIELGKGFYTSPDFQGAAVYAPIVGRPAAIIHMKLKNEASGKVFLNTRELDRKSEKHIKDTYNVDDFVTDKDVSQIKFHNPFYLENLAIDKVFVMEEEDIWKPYTTEEFVDSYRKHIVERHKQKSAEIDPDEDMADAPMDIAEVDNPSPLLGAAPDAHRRVMEAIEYSTAAIDFETRLGNYLATYGPALDQVSALVTVAWNKVKEDDKQKFGTRQSENTGMVGDDLISLLSVVRHGNLREKFTFLYNGYQKNIFGRLERPEFFTTDREGRENRPKEDAATVRTPHPDKLSLPLSDREWFGAVDASGKLGWKPGEAKYHYKMNTKFQEEAELLLAPVGSGTSGTAYGILQMAAKLADEESVDVDYQLVRLGLLGWMIPAGDHTFHEIMTACKIFSPGLDYDPGLNRYKNIPPLETSFLRDHIAKDGLFPGERIPPKSQALVLHDQSTLDLSLINAFAILQIPYQSVLDPRLLRSQYYDLALKYHPDKNLEKEEEANAMFKRIVEAYQRILEGKKQDEIRFISS